MEYPPFISKARRRLQHSSQWKQNDQSVIILIVDRPVVNITPMRREPAEGPTFGGLREQIVVRLRAQGIEAEDENVIVSYGSSQILALLPQVFVDPGEMVLIEGPSFMGAVRYFADAGARLVTVPTDADGMD